MLAWQTPNWAHSCWDRRLITGPEERRGTVGICPSHFLAATLTLSQSGGTDYAHHIGMSQTNFQLFPRACRRLIASGNDRQLPTQSIWCLSLPFFDRISRKRQQFINSVWSTINFQKISCIYYICNSIDLNFIEAKNERRCYTSNNETIEAMEQNQITYIHQFTLWIWMDNI